MYHRLINLLIDDTSKNHGYYRLNCHVNEPIYIYPDQCFLCAVFTVNSKFFSIFYSIICHQPIKNETIGHPFKMKLTFSHFMVASRNCKQVAKQLQLLHTKNGKLTFERLNFSLQWRQDSETIRVVLSVHACKLDCILLFFLHLN